MENTTDTWAARCEFFT